jgi:hypothetical protein
MAVSGARRTSSNPIADLLAFVPVATPFVSMCRDCVRAGGGGDNPIINVSNGNEPQSAAGGLQKDQ